MAWLTVYPSISFADLGNLTLSVSTDKKVYSSSERIRVEVIANNPTNHSFGIHVGQGYYRTLLAVDTDTGMTAYQIDDLAVENNYIQVLTPHAQSTFVVTEIPANVLPPGKKYNIVSNISLDLENLESHTREPLFTNAGTVITVRESGAPK